MPTRHLIIGGGTAGMNAMRTIREEEREPSEITLVSAERPYSRMVLPYYLDRSVAESHVFTATGIQLGQWKVKAFVGRRAAALDTKANVCTLDAKLTIVEVAPRILPRMVDATGGELVEAWLKAHGVAIRANAKLTKIEDAKDRKRLKFASGGDLTADVVIMATGIRNNLEWLKGSGVVIDRGVVVDGHLRSNVANVYAAGDSAQGKDLISGQGAIHAIEPTAQEHGRIVGANMAGKSVAYRGSLIINIVEVCHLDVASFGAWDDGKAEPISGLKKD